MARWLAPPVLVSEESTRQARLFTMVAWPFVGVAALVLSIMVAVEPATIGRRAITIAALALLVAVLHEISRRGRPALASWMLVIGLVLIVTQRAMNTGGVHAPVAVFYTLFVILAGLLLDTRAAIVTAMVAFAGATFLTVAEMVGWLPAASDGRGPMPWLVLVALTLALALVIQTLVRPARAMPAHHPVEPPSDAAPPVRERVSADTTDVVELARQVVTGFARAHPQRSIVVHAKAPVRSRHRPAVLQLVLEHLLDNAVAHAPAGDIEVHVSSWRGVVRVAVEDAGPGIPDAVQRRLRDDVRPASSRRSGPHAAGLGLLLCKASVEAVGGTIRVEKATPHGSIVIVELPA